MIDVPARGRRYGDDVSDEGPRIPLPDEITISRDEAGILPAALDLGEAPVNAELHPTIRRAIRVVTA
jgi:hypothetical protein